MDDLVKTEKKSYRLIENLEGRIANLAMAPSLENTLIPVFEALMNSIHSVQERFGENQTDKGFISLTIHTDDNGNPHSFTIEDNGIGLNDNNFKSFRTYDSRYKIKKGGKGVGRLTWLKVFEGVHVNSLYEGSDDNQLIRSFDFVLDNDNPVQNVEERQVIHKLDDLKTLVKLNKFHSGYFSRCPKKIETLKNHVVAHFLSFLLGDICPDIYVTHEGKDYILRDDIAEHSHRSETDTFEAEDEKAGISDLGKFTIKHVMLSKALAENKEHKIYLAAHDRIVSEHVINNQTGLDTTFNIETESGDEDEVVYVGIVSAEFLDENVTQERNNFDVPEKILKLIRKQATNKAKDYLHEPIERVIDAKVQMIDKVIKSFPRYQYLVKNKRKFATDNLQLNSKKEEDIYKEMSVYDFRENREARKALSELLAEEIMPDGEEFQKKMKDLIHKAGEQGKASLAEYVGKRKLVIDLLQSRLGYEDFEKRKKYTEEAVHRVICPLRVDSGQIEYDDHNLWLLDDRLAYYDYWASDKQIQSFARDSDSQDRPDVVLFKGSTLLHRPNTSQPAVIVEFKRPTRDDYTESENPITQVYGYIDQLRSKKIDDNNGELITMIGDETPFFCYIVCDVTPKLETVIKMNGGFQKLPGGRGYCSYNKDYRAYVEILDYRQLVDDARLRHEAFFKKMGIN